MLLRPPWRYGRGGNIRPLCQRQYFLRRLTRELCGSHISRAFRKVSECLHDKGEYVAAFEKLGIVEEDQVLKSCSSGAEKEKIEDLKARLIFTSGAGSET